MERETGGPAFPVPIAGDTAGFVDGQECGAPTGLTIRDYFASSALQGITSDSKSVIGFQIAGQAEGKKTTRMIADSAYEIADAMLAARAISKATGE